MKGRRDFRRFGPLAREGPTLATLVRPRSENLFAEKVFGLGEKAWFRAALVGHERGGGPL